MYKKCLVFFSDILKLFCFFKQWLLMFTDFLCSKWKKKIFLLVGSALSRALKRLFGAIENNTCSKKKNTISSKQLNTLSSPTSDSYHTYYYYYMCVRFAGLLRLQTTRQLRLVFRPEIKEEKMLIIKKKNN